MFIKYLSRGKKGAPDPISLFIAFRIDCAQFDVVDQLVERSCAASLLGQSSNISRRNQEFEISTNKLQGKATDFYLLLKKKIVCTEI